MQTQIDNTENNILIAKFLGWKEQTDPTRRWFTQFFNEYGERKGGTNKEPLLFHSDWNWLMLAVEKINSFESGRFTVQINSMDTYIHDLVKGGYIFQSECKWQTYELINSVYEAVIEFIKWYNEQQKAG